MSSSKLTFDDSCQVILTAAGDEFCKFKFSYARSLRGNGHATIVFAYCLNLLRMKIHNERDKRQLAKDGEWFPCPAKDIEAVLGMKPERRRNAIDNLIKAKLLETKNWAGNEQWIRVDTKKLKGIEDADREARIQKSGKSTSRNRESRLLEIGKANGSYTKNPSENHSNGRTADAADDGFGVQLNCSGNDRKIAVYLYETLLRKGLIPGKPNLAAWSKHIQKMFTIDGIPPERVKAGLDWYCEHIGEKYVSECYCTESFRKKFSAIEAAMRRGQAKKQEESFIW